MIKELAGEKKFLEFKSQGSLNVKNCETSGLQRNKQTKKKTQKNKKIKTQKMLKASRQKSQVMCKYK